MWHGNHTPKGTALGAMQHRSTRGRHGLSAGFQSLRIHYSTVSGDAIKRETVSGLRKAKRWRVDTP